MYVENHSLFEWHTEQHTFTLYARITSHHIYAYWVVLYATLTQRILSLVCVSLHIYVYVRVCASALEWYFKLYICFIDKTLERPKRSAKRMHTLIHKFAPHIPIPSTHVRSCSCSCSRDSLSLLSILSIQYVCFLFTISSALIRLRFPFRLLFLFLLLAVVVVVVVMVFFASFLLRFPLVCQSLVFPYRARSSCGFVCLCV